MLTVLKVKIKIFLIRHLSLLCGHQIPLTIIGHVSCFSDDACLQDYVEDCYATVL